MVKVQAGQPGDRVDDLRKERFLGDAHFPGDAGFEDENPRHAGNVVTEVEMPLGLVRDVAEQRAVGLLADGHGRER